MFGIHTYISWLEAKAFPSKDKNLQVQCWWVSKTKSRATLSLALAGWGFRREAVFLVSAKLKAGLRFKQSPSILNRRSSVSRLWKGFCSPSRTMVWTTEKLTARHLIQSAVPTRPSFLVSAFIGHNRWPAALCTDWVGGRLVQVYVFCIAADSRAGLSR